MASFKQWLETQNSAGVVTDPTQVKNSAADAANRWLGDPNNADNVGLLQKQFGTSQFQTTLNKFGALAARQFGTQGTPASPMDMGVQIAREALPRKQFNTLGLGIAAMRKRMRKQMKRK